MSCVKLLLVAPIFSLYLINELAQVWSYYTQNRITTDPKLPFWKLTHFFWSHSETLWRNWCTHYHQAIHTWLPASIHIAAVNTFQVSFIPTAPQPPLNWPLS